MENNQKPFNLPFSENLPIILIGNLSVEPLRAAGIIEEALTLVEDKLTEFIASPTLATDLQTVFGQSTDIPWARTLLDALPARDELPQITLVSAELMNGAVGGFDSLTGTVYLADSLIDANSVMTSDTEPSPHLVNVIIEELGHWLDSQLNQVDTPGDEGEWLAALVQGDGLSASEIARLRSETDQVVVTLEDQTVILEASEPSFTEDSSVSLPGVWGGSVAWADYNGDGKQDFLLTGGDGKPDLLLTGEDNSYNYISKLYKNTGNGFIEDTSVSLPGVVSSSVAWADYNGDGKPDFLLTGWDNSYNYISKLYKNTGSGFSEDTSVSLPGVYNGSVAWADYNGDGKPDFLLTGYDGNSYNRISKLYKNTGSGFIEDTSVSLPGVGWSSVAWADYNGDGKQDLLLTGDGNSYNYISKLYKNTGNGFIEDTSVSLPAVGNSSVAWADYNEDGKPDFLLTGWDGNSYNYISKLYKNTGSGFSEDTSVSLPAIGLGSVAWSDYDGDGKPDFLLTGYDGNSYNYISKLYKNTGSGFSEDTSVSLPGVGFSSVAWADYNGDGKQDFLLTGYDGNSGSTISKLYKNTTSTVNSDAVAPELVGVSLTARSVDASSGQGSMGVKLQVSDNSSGFNYGSVSFSSPSGQNSFGLYLRDDPSYLVSGTELAGTYSIKELLPEGAEAGTWTFSSLSLSDDAGNYGYYDGNALQLLGINPNSLSFTVTNVNSDAVAPELIGVNLTATSVDVSSGQGSMGVKLQVSDNSSGFNYGSVSFSSPSGQNSFGLYLRDDPSYLVSGTELAGTYSIKELLPEGAEAGTWTFSSLSLSDDAGNYGYYDGNALQLLGINPNSLSFTVKYTTPTSAQISIKDTQIIEGDNGKKQAKFTVSLNTPSTQTVTVNYATTNGTAKLGEDYQRTNGKLTFKPGETSKTINVPVFGDTKLEGNETFKLLLSKPKNAQLGKKQAIGSITNDDLTKISIKDTQIIEGDDGKKQAKFTVSLNTKVNQKVEVSYATSDGTAKVGEDYQRTNGKLTFQPNQTQKTIIVPILGDTIDEDDETFFLNLSKPKNADLGDKRAIGKITDNDTGGDKPGDSFKTAVNLGKVKQEIIRDDDIGFLEGGSYRDTDDYYRFQLERKGTLVLTLQGLFKDADINLYGSEEELITQGINDGTNPEIIQQQLDPGIYYVRVYPKVKTYTNYRLTVDFS
ncbi:FG-GAP-like repeat-containing protein [Planktothrix agardhii 1803]|uniref:FG-GAP repeat domain-containing protein n=1 Tax=Planktothrix agardhii TaxID=1160 RepID=UPI001F2C61EB|nr:VCBS repeat-containing protein [Planktothrix agardhii]MCF3586290.1 FG-GAP-like repeat-containing protein [Planktothrix agardhii 1803]